MRIFTWVGAVTLWTISCWAHAESFTVESIEVIGNKKITIGTVLSYFPVNVGETLDTDKTPELIRELYSTGFFDDIELLRSDNALIIKVVERPSIAEVNFEGNDDIEDESLEQALDQVGMSKGRIFNENQLEKLELELQQIYYSLGKYAARIDASWRTLDENRVAIDINISEGLSATIRSINITGNQTYGEEELLDLFELEPSSAGMFPSDDYSSTKLSADLETLRSFYLDRGFIQFDVVSQQVTISPDRKDFSIAISISEGEQFTLSKVDVGGELVVDAAELLALINIREGEVFSRKKINQVIETMKKRLGEDGYAFAQIRVRNEIDEENKTVSLQFLVVPGNKMRVRYINFVGNEKTKDLVLRREMRQFEGEIYQRSKVDRSKVRLQRLNYIATVNLGLQKVAGVEDQVDIEVTVTERFAGNLQLGLGYSQVQGVIVNVGFKHENIFGSGNSVDVTFDNSASTERYGFKYENPYYTADGISRGFNFSFTETDASENNTSNYLLDRISMSVDYGIPLSEFNTLRFEVGALQTQIETSSESADEVFDFIIANSDEYDESTPRSEIEEETFDTFFSTVGFAKDTRNRRIFADSGHLNSVSLEVQSGDLDFYKVRYRHQTAYKLSENFTLSLKARLGYGEGTGDYDDLPLYEKFFAGGPRSVRGYEQNSLGPLDSTNDPLGGNFQVVTSAEVLFPLEYLGSSETFRLGVYFDAGNVFEDVDAYESSELRRSVGLSAKWFSVIGPIEFSYAFPDDQPGDDTREFQFLLGATF